MDREERDRIEQEERQARKQELREAQLKKKKQEEQMMIGGGIILLAVIVLIIALIARSCNHKKNPEDTKAESRTESVKEDESSSETAPSATEKQTTEAASSESESEESTDAASQDGGESEAEATEPAAVPTGPWDLATLENEPKYFGYAPENRDPATGIPTDWAWYESQWGQFNVDWIQDTSQNIIYLTMDEGYPNEYTNTILDILAEKNVKACFFLTKTFLDGGEQSSAQVNRMIADGHVLGNHTVSHRSMPTLSIEEQTVEIETVNRLVKDTYNYDMKLFRFPEGLYSSQTLGLVDNLGMKTCFWSYAYNDYSEEQPPVEESLQAAINGLHPGAIYLLHANSSTNTAFLAQWIDEARARGYEFGVYPVTPN